MPKLSDAERKERDEARALAFSQQVQARWQEGLSKASSKEADAGRLWADAVASKQLNLRHLWLILGVFETEERIQAAGKSTSCKTRWFDNIAPRKDGWYGSAGFAARMAGKASHFLKISGNGYLYLTDLGLALVQHLRGQHPELDVAKFNGNSSWPLDVPGLGIVPAPRWKAWQNWA
jgi:hypothetical protein